MGICPCGYWWADCDEEGTPISLEYCHFDGPDGWAPCEQDAYEDYETDEYLNWLYSADYDEGPTFEEYGAPYDYQEF